jgi:hypothetical protein
MGDGGGRRLTRSGLPLVAIADMKWTSRSALAPVPPWAVVSSPAVQTAERALTSGEGLERAIRTAYEALDHAQPELAAYLSSEFERAGREDAEALGCFLAVCVHEAFRRAFGPRIARVDRASIELVRASLALDESLRREDPCEPLESDDVIALGQPHLMAFIREQVESVLESDEESDPDVDLDGVDIVYRASLVALLALSAAVTPPEGAAAPPRILS